MIRVQAEPFDVGAELAALAPGRTDVGATVSFTGHVRGPHGLDIEHWPGMTDTALAAVEAEAQARWPLIASLIVHRHGALAPGAPIVLVATASAHRAAAFEAAMYLMDHLKTRAPFWKKEAGAWVAARPEDDAAQARWG